MHSASHCIKRPPTWLLLIVLALLATLVPRHAHAQTAASVTCDMSGSTGCVSPNLPQGVSCQFLNSEYYCYDSGGSVGLDCQFSGGLNCSQSSAGAGATGTAGSGGADGNVPNGNSAVQGGGWLDKLTGWLANAIHAIFQALIDLLKDVLLFFVVIVFELVELIVGSITPPAFISQYSMGSVLGSAGPIMGFFMSELKVGAALALIGAAYAFRLLRKFLTLFQW